MMIFSIKKVSTRCDLAPLAAHWSGPDLLGGAEKDNCVLLGLTPL